MTDQEFIEGIKRAVVRQYDAEGDTGKIARAFVYLIRRVETTVMGSTFTGILNDFKAELNGQKKAA